VKLTGGTAVFKAPPPQRGTKAQNEFLELFVPFVLFVSKHSNLILVPPCVEGGGVITKNLGLVIRF
jgi:hypothetical protein